MYIKFSTDLKLSPEVWKKLQQLVIVSMSVFFFFLKEKNRKRAPPIHLNKPNTSLFFKNCSTVSQKISAQDRNKVGDHALHVFFAFEKNIRLLERNKKTSTHLGVIKNPSL